MKGVLCELFNLETIGVFAFSGKTSISKSLKNGGRDHES